MLRALIPAVALVFASAAAARAPSQSRGYPWEGRLVGGVQLASQGSTSSRGTPSATTRPTAAGAGSATNGCCRHSRGCSPHTRPRFPTAAASAWATSAGRGAATSAAALAASGTRRARTGSTSTSTTLAATGGASLGAAIADQPEGSLRTSSTASSSPAQRGVRRAEHGTAGPPAVVEVLPAYRQPHARALPRGRLAAGPDQAQHRGRPIRAFAAGRGRPDVLVFGTIHGDERAGIAVASRLVQTQPPAGGTVWVVPDLNPDGLAARTRWNARGVDLNRNFPGSWRASRRAGAAPASETETRVAMRLIRQLRPHVTIWFHQPQALVRSHRPQRRDRPALREAGRALPRASPVRRARRPSGAPLAPRHARLRRRAAAGSAGPARRGPIRRRCVRACRLGWRR